jgi:hypothetical protein
MDVSYSKVKGLIEGFEEGQYGKYFDLEILVEHLAEERAEMDGEEAVLRLLDALSKDNRR